MRFCSKLACSEASIFLFMLDTLILHHAAIAGNNLAKAKKDSSWYFADNGINTIPVSQNVAREHEDACNRPRIGRALPALSSKLGRLRGLWDKPNSISRAVLATAVVSTRS
jgi:hypothetical protein